MEKTTRKVDMKDRASLVFVIVSTVLAAALAVGLAAVSLRQTPDLHGQSSTEARAAAIAPEVAGQIRDQLGTGWGVEASVSDLQRYRGRFGLPAWQADYRLVITSTDVPSFRHVAYVSRSLGPGAQNTDQSLIPDPKVFDALRSLPSEQRASLLRGLNNAYASAELTGVQKLREDTAEDASTQLTQSNPDVTGMVERAGVAVGDVYVVTTSHPEAIDLWGWNGTTMKPLGSWDSTSHSVRPGTD